MTSYFCHHTLCFVVIIFIYDDIFCCGLHQGNKAFNPTFTCSKSKNKTLETCDIYSNLTIDTRTMSGTSIIDFESILHVILLFLLLNSNMQMLVGFEKLVRNIFCYRLGKSVGLHVFILIHLI